MLAPEERPPSLAGNGSRKVAILYVERSSQPREPGEVGTRPGEHAWSCHVFVVHDAARARDPNRHAGKALTAGSRPGVQDDRGCGAIALPGARPPVSERLRHRRE